jgi:hypothetical protein
MKLTLKHAVAVLFGTLWMLNASAQKTPLPQLTMPKAPANVTIDGDLSEWTDSTFVYNAENNFKYLISNDATNLYIVANITDHNTRRKITGAGLTISFNTEGKKHKTYSISYPAAPNKELSYVLRSQSQLVTAKVDGFKGLEDNITLPDDHGFKGVYAFTDTAMLYELAIPLKALNLKPGTNNLNINILLSALDQNVTSAITSESGPSKGGRGGGGGGSRTNSHGPTITSKPSNMFVDTDFWLSYTLTN